MRHNQTNEIRQRCDVKNMYLIRKQIKQKKTSGQYMNQSYTNPTQCGVFFSLEISTVSYNKDKKKNQLNYR